MAEKGEVVGPFGPGPVVLPFPAQAAGAAVSHEDGGATEKPCPPVAEDTRSPMAVINRIN